MIQNIYWSSCKVLVIFVRYELNFNFSRQILKKYPNKKFDETQSSGILLVPCGQTDRHYEASNRFSQL
jgi:hypothetical protein